MVFSNLTFVCLFLPITLALYFSSPKSLHNAVLVLASVVFYIWGGRVAIVLVLISVAVNFRLGQAIAAAGPERRDRLIRWSVAGNLLVLIVFKYLDFIVDNVNVVLDAYWHWKIPEPATSRCRSAFRSSRSTSFPIWSTSIAASRRRSARPFRSRSTSSISRS